MAVFDEAALENAMSFGANRIVVGSGTSDLSALKDEMSAFAEKFIVA